MNYLNKINFSFLRNKKICKTKKEAIDSLKANLDKAIDGSIVLSRYKAKNSIKTIMGVVYSDEINKQITLFEGTNTI